MSTIKMLREKSLEVNKGFWQIRFPNYSKAYAGPDKRFYLVVESREKISPLPLLALFEQIVLVQDQVPAH